MMYDQQGRRKNRIVPSILIGGGACYVLQNYTGWLFVGTSALINPYAIIPSLLLVLAVAAFGEDFFWAVGNRYELKAAYNPTGQKGTAAFVESLEEIQHELSDQDNPYWGCFEGYPIFSKIGSNSLVLGTSGSGKGIGEVQPNGMFIKGSKLFSDLKSENACILARALRERGENVRILNLGDINTHILGESDYYNPLFLIADAYQTPGSLIYVSDDVHEFKEQLNPEPVGQVSSDGNKYFRDGARDLLGFAVQICVILHQDEATLGHVASMLKDKQSLLKHAQWVCGRLKQNGSTSH